MNISLDQARALDALERQGTFKAAARALGKQHSAVVYAIHVLEEQTGLTLLDRTGYRTRLSEAGRRVLEECRRLLEVERSLAAVVETIRSGWEPRLCIVFDGLFPARPILKHVAPIAGPRTPTKVQVFAEFLSGVEEAFVQEQADLMVSVLPPKETRLQSRALAPLPAHLVVHRAHPLAGSRKVSAEELARHTLLTVRGSDPRLMLSTAALEPGATVHLNDFATKKEAILAGMGFGWLPAYLCEAELERGQLRTVSWERESRHLFRPHIYFRSERGLGRGAKAVVEGLVGEG